MIDRRGRDDIATAGDFENFLGKIIRCLRGRKPDHRPTANIAAAFDCLLEFLGKVAIKFLRALVQDKAEFDEWSGRVFAAR